MISLIYSRTSFFILLAFICATAFFLYSNKSEIIYQDATQKILVGDKRIQLTSGFIKDSLSQDYWVAFVFESEGIFEKETIENIGNFSDEIYKLDKTSNQLGLSNILVPRVIKGQVTPRFEWLIPAQPYESVDWDVIKKEAQTVSYIKNIVISENLKNSTMLYNFSIENESELEPYLASLDKLVKKYETKSLKIHTIGLPIIAKEVKESINENAIEKGAVAFILIAFFLVLICRKIKFLVNIFFATIANLCVCLSVMFLFNVKFDYYQLLLLPFVISVQLTFLLHFFVIYRKKETLCSDVNGCILQTLKEVGTASITACLTTIFGFLSFLTSDIEELRLFGVLGAVFVLCALLISYGPCLSTLLFYGHAQETRSGISKVDGVWNIVLNKKIVFLVFCVLSGCTVYLAFHFKTIKVDERAIQYLPDNSVVKKGLRILSEDFGGIHLLTITAEADKLGALHRPEALKFLLTLEEELIKFDKVSAVYSYAMLLVEVNQKFKEILGNTNLNLLGKNDSVEQSRFDLMPSGLTLATISSMLDTYNAKGMQLVIDDKRQVAKIYIRSQDIDNSEYVALVENVVDRVKELAPPFVTIKPVDGLHSFLEKENSVKESLISSFVVCAIPSFIVFCFLFKSFYFAIIALFSNAVAVGVMLLICGVYDIPLNAITILAFSISFVIAVDDSIHLIKAYLKMPSHVSVQDKIRDLFVLKGWAVLGTSLVLTTCALFFMSVNFPPIFNFGLILCVSLTISLLINIFIVPLFFFFKKGDYSAHN